MFTRACTSLPRRLPLHPASSRRLLSNSPNIYQKTRSPKIGLRFAAYGCRAVFAACVTGAAAVVTLCEEDRLERWSNRWATGNVRWHRAKPNDGLVNHYDRFLGPTNAQSPSKAGAPNHRVLVPLCGKSVDMPFLAEKGHEVLGVECAEAAAWQLQRDFWLKFETSQERPAAGAAGGGRRPEFIPASTFEKKRLGYVFKTDVKGTGYYLDSKAVKWFRDTKRRISLVIDDFLHVTPSEMGTFDRIWDRGALVAVRPEDREDYVATCDSLLEPGGRILLATLVYDQEKMKGPPFSIPLAEAQRLYGGKLGYKVEVLSSFDARMDYQGGKWDKLKTSRLDEEVLLLTKPASSGPGWFARVFWRRTR